MSGRLNVVVDESVLCHSLNEIALDNANMDNAYWTSKRKVAPGQFYIHLYDGHSLSNCILIDAAPGDLKTAQDYLDCRWRDCPRY